MLLPFTTLGCALLCDDFMPAKAASQRDCPACREWFDHLCSQAALPIHCTIHHQSATFDEAITHIRQQFQSSRRPAIVADGHLTAAQSHLLIDLAHQERAILTTQLTSADAALASHLARRGSSTGTLSEIASRSDVVVLWNLDPQQDAPRFWEKLRVSPTSTTRFFSLGTTPVKGPRQIKSIVLTSPQAATEALTNLRLLLSGQALWPPQPALEDLASALLQADNPTFLLGDHHAALHRPHLVRQWVELHVTLRDRHRAFLLSIPSSPVALTTSTTLLSRTGYPDAFDFAAVGPQINEDLSLETLLAEGDIDLLVVVAERVSERLTGVLTSASHQPLLVAVASNALASPKLSDSATILTTPLETPSFIIRCDNVPIPTRYPDLHALRPPTSQVLSLLLRTD